MIEIGLEKCIRQPPSVLKNSRFGLLMNQASVDRQFHYACDILAERFPGKLRAIFSPQHGLWGEQQANMIESPHGVHARLNVPLFSLYSETRRPTPEMLNGLDCFVVDLQDVGTRVYTFLWTITHCLEACAAAGIPVVILDRPNPIGGDVVEGPELDPRFASFVGRAAIPMRHGLTVGELSRWANQELGIRATVEVVPMTGWQRRMEFRDTGRVFVPPSPNMPRWETALLYPGQVMLEGTNLSEGRGTTIPFEVVGAPFVDPFRLHQELAAFSIPGITLRPIRFVPMFDKWRGESCGGLALHLVDPPSVRSFRLTIAILMSIRKLWPNDFAWLPPPYEYEQVKMPIDILYGSDRLRLAIETADVLEVNRLDDLAGGDPSAWKTRTAACRIYE